MDYHAESSLIKAIANPNRLKIIDILSCGEQCACDLLDHFNFSQPTLSHHVNILAKSDLVKVRKQGQWNYYSLNQPKCTEIIIDLMQMFNQTEECICKEKSPI